MRTVGSLYLNLERALSDAMPSGIAAPLLGARWTFAFPDADRFAELTEYSLPLHPEGFFATLAARTDVRVRAHAANDLRAALEDGIAAIALVDSFHLPYRPAFGRVHSHRTVIVRRGARRGAVEIDDVWPPAFRGPISSATFERARFSEVALDPLREPIFAGRAIAGEWYALDGVPRLAADRFDWAASLLDVLLAEGREDRVVDGVAYGPRAMRAFQEHLRAGGDRRTASLLLRAELGARVYFCAFLAAAARWLGDRSLASTAAWYFERLRAMELARDVLAKSLAHPEPRHHVFVLDRLRDAFATEAELAARLGPWSLTTHTRIA